MSEITFSDLFNNSWESFKEKLNLFLPIVLIFQFIPSVLLAIYMLMKFGTTTIVEPSVEQVIFLLKNVLPMSILVGILSLFAFVSMVYGIVKNTKTVGETLKGGTEYVFNAILLGLLLIVFLIPLFIALVIPGIIFSIYWAFAYYALVTDNTGLREALGKSKKAVEGRWWKVFGYFILIGLIIMAISIVIGFIAGIIIHIFGMRDPSFGFELSKSITSQLISAVASIFTVIFGEKFYRLLKSSSN